MRKTDPGVVEMTHQLAEAPSEKKVEDLVEELADKFSDRLLLKLGAQEAKKQDICVGDEPQKITVTHAEYEEYLKNWFASRVEDGPQHIIELAKFCFGASAAACGVLATLAKVFESSVNLIGMLFGMLLLIVSMGAAFWMIRPRKISVDKLAGDIGQAYYDQMSSGKYPLLIWLGCGFFGAAIGFIALLWKTIIQGLP